jgi:DNA-binding HxlR family transcriptional regulator
MACPIAQSLEIFGEWWSPLILRDTIMFNITRFDELQRELGIAPTVLTDRLNTLVDAGLLERRRYNDRPPRFEYIPTQAGRDVEPILKALAKWGRRWTEVPEKREAVD